MSITIDLSPEIERQLAAMPEEERARFVADAIVEKLDEFPAALACSLGVDKRPLTEEETVAIMEAIQAPAQGPTEAMKETIRNWKKLTGHSA